MICSDKNNEMIIIKCDCGAEAIEISSSDINETEKEYYIYTIMKTWYTKQYSFTDRFKEKLKMIWYILIGKDYLLTEIILSEEEFKELKEIIIKL